MNGSNSSISSELVRLVSPKTDRTRAQFVLRKIDEILEWERHSEDERDKRFVELGRYLCEVRAGQYWRIERLRSFDEFLEKRFPDSRRKAYYLMSIHEHLPAEARKELEQVGWTKAAELAKLARSEGKQFNCAAWLHKAHDLTREEFKRQVEQYLTGCEVEPTDIFMFRLTKAQMNIVEEALDVAMLMLGTDKSRGYCVEMICADFLAGAYLENGNAKGSMRVMLRYCELLPIDDRQQFIRALGRL